MTFETRRIGAYAVLYLVWGSTYLAMRVAVETLPPFSLAAARFLFAGLILAGWALARGARRPRRADWIHAASVGALLFIGGNASVLWALQHVPSGVAALVVAITPLWLALFQGARPSARKLVGIGLGLAGVGILVGPALASSAAGLNPLALGVLVAASMSWAAGSLVQRRGTGSSPLLLNGLEMLVGAAMLASLAVATGEASNTRAILDASARSWAALAYLAVFGSLLGFTSYAWLMRHDDPARVATYAYVNPVIAVILGALVAGEQLTPRIAVAAVVIVGGVFVIVTDARSQRR